MAKIAVELEKALAHRAAIGASGGTSARRLAQGEGWSVADVVCTSGPQDLPFEEQHSNISVAIVVAGTFQYHGEHGKELMSPGSLLLGNVGQYFECRHDHGRGDRCISFSYKPDHFERLAFDAGVQGRRPAFKTIRLPQLRALSSIVAQCVAGLGSSADAPWEEISLELAVGALRLAEGQPRGPTGGPPSTLARVTRAVRAIERHPQGKLTVATLAQEAGLSPYHFLRTFQSLTGLTPHQYLLRARLREAARHLVAEQENILDIALDCGFGDVSNFNHAFRREFGVNPRVFRRQGRRIPV